MEHLIPIIAAAVVIAFAAGVFTGMLVYREILKSEVKEDHDAD